VIFTCFLYCHGGVREYLTIAHVTHVLIEGAGLVKHIARVCFVGHIPR
jgi:hypothetical protein